VGYFDEAQQRNYERWPILGEYVWPNYNWYGNDYTDEVAFFETWLFNRIGWIDYNVQGSLLYPFAELSGYSSELEITLTDDYFSRPILKKKYFTLNNAPIGLEIDTVIFLNASQATLLLSGNVINPIDLSVTMKAKILNSFEDLTSSVLTVGVDFESYIKPEIALLYNQNNLHFDCTNPELLGERLEVFNLSGQLIDTFEIMQSKINTLSINLTPGIYLCRFQFKNILHTRRVIIMK
jgi:hypothetical protein